MLHYFHDGQPFPLEGGAVLPELDIAYHTYGTLNAAGDNVVWVCHALTASADAKDWWAGLFDGDTPVNEKDHFIVCANILGSCYGTTGPLHNDPATGMPYYGSFPAITIRDMVQAHIRLRKHLGITRIRLLIGGSMGGYQALEWALAEPPVIQSLFLLATAATESAWGISIHTAQRLAIEADGTFGDADPQAGAKGLKAARAIGMITYRNHHLMNAQQTDEEIYKLDHYKAESYIRYQGDKLVARFNAYSYYTLTKAMDTHQIARGRQGSTEAILNTLTLPVLLAGISSDLLCPVAGQHFMARHLPRAHYEEIDSPYGHDGFLVEHEQINKVLAAWMKSLAV